jgi:hypothetical protein
MARFRRAIRDDGRIQSRWPSAGESVQNSVVEKEVLAVRVEAARAEGGHTDFETFGYHQHGWRYE